MNSLVEELEDRLQQTLIDLEGPGSRCSVGTGDDFFCPEVQLVGRLVELVPDPVDGVDDLIVLVDAARGDDGIAVVIFAAVDVDAAVFVVPDVRRI